MVNLLGGTINLARRYVDMQIGADSLTLTVDLLNRIKSNQIFILFKKMQNKKM